MRRKSFIQRRMLCRLEPTLELTSRSERCWSDTWTGKQICQQSMPMIPSLLPTSTLLQIQKGGRGGKSLQLKNRWRWRLKSAPSQLMMAINDAARATMMCSGWDVAPGLALIIEGGEQVGGANDFQMKLLEANTVWFLQVSYLSDLILSELSFFSLKSRSRNLLSFIDHDHIPEIRSYDLFYSSCAIDHHWSSESKPTECLLGSVRPESVIFTGYIRTLFLIIIN